TSFVPAEGMNRNGCVQALRLLVEWIEFGVAEILIVRLSRTHASTKSELGYGAVEFLDGLGRVVDRKVGDSLQPRRRFTIIGNEIVIRPAEGGIVFCFQGRAHAKTRGRIS